MKIKIEFAAFTEQLLVPNQGLGSATSLLRDAKHKDVEMEFDSELQMLVIQMKKDSKPILVPPSKIKNLVAAGPLTPPKKAI